MSIQRRTVFYDNTGGIKRFWDWAQVTTTLGSMAEPHNGQLKHERDTDFTALDPTDEIARIDEIRALPADRHQLVLSGGDHHLIGGYQLPRTGR